MSKILLLIQSESDVAELPEAAKRLPGLGITGVWCIYSPAIAVDQNAAKSQFDEEIAKIQAAESDAASRANYDVAQTYKAQREAKTLERDTALRDAWKAIPDETRVANVKKKLAPLFDVLRANGMSGKITGLSDHFEPGQVAQMLNSLSGTWFAPFEHGKYAIMWPSSVPVSKVQAPVNITPEAAAAIPAPVAPKPTQKPLNPYDELMKAPFFTMRGRAIKSGVAYEGRKREDVVKEILEKESALATA